MKRIATFFFLASICTVSLHGMKKRKKVDVSRNFFQREILTDDSITEDVRKDVNFLLKVSDRWKNYYDPFINIGEWGEDPNDDVQKMLQEKNYTYIKNFLLLADSLEAPFPYSTIVKKLISTKEGKKSAQNILKKWKKVLSSEVQCSLKDNLYQKEKSNNDYRTYDFKKQNIIYEKLNHGNTIKKLVPRRQQEMDDLWVGSSFDDELDIG